MKHGVVELEGGVSLPDGTRVTVELLQPLQHEAPKRPGTSGRLGGAERRRLGRSVKQRGCGRLHRAEILSLARRAVLVRPDKDWGLTDCVSFALMMQEGISEALTADVHFRQAGFTVLLLEDDE